MKGCAERMHINLETKTNFLTSQIHEIVKLCSESYIYGNKKISRQEIKMMADENKFQGSAKCLLPVLSSSSFNKATSACAD